MEPENSNRPTDKQSRFIIDNINLQFLIEAENEANNLLLAIVPEGTEGYWTVFMMSGKDGWLKAKNNNSRGHDLASCYGFVDEITVIHQNINQDCNQGMTTPILTDDAVSSVCWTVGWLGTLFILSQFIMWVIRH